MVVMCKIKHTLYVEEIKSTTLHIVRNEIEMVLKSFLSSTIEYDSNEKRILRSDELGSFLQKSTLCLIMIRRKLYPK